MRTFVLFFVTLSLLCSQALAEPLRVDRSGERMRVDGALLEWKGARFTTLGSGDDTAIRFAVATADGGLYLGAEVSDERLVRRPQVGKGQDALVLTLVMPVSDKNSRATDIWLFPGEAGRNKALAAIGEAGKPAKSVSDVRVVEGPRKGGPGYVIEAFIPWSSVPGSEIWEQGRAALRFEDVDSETRGEDVTVLSTATSARPSDLPRIALGEGHQDFLGSFLKSKEMIGVEPRFDLRGQVFGDARLERVVIVDSFLIVYGAGYQDGQSFGFMQLPLGTGGGIKSAELSDVTGDGIEELVTVLRQRNELGAREVWLAITLKDPSPRVWFGVETRKELAGGFVEATFAIERAKKGPVTITLSRGRASGVDASSYREGRATDLVPILLPWEPVLSRRYRFDGTTLAMIDEKADPKAPKQVDEKHKVARADTSYEEMEPMTPTQEAVLAHFKEKAGLSESLKPTRHVKANVLGKRTQEDLFLFDRTLVIVGPEVGDGAGFIAYGLPVSQASDLRHVGAADVTGDGLAEIFVRVRQPLGGAEGVFRGVMLVHRVDEKGRVNRILSVEAFRYQGQNRIANQVSVTRGKLVVAPGIAVGWSESNYPFLDEAVAGTERLLLPWKDVPQVYELDGSRLVVREGR